jgi:hypothetical protein
MVSFTPIAVALLGLASYPDVAAFAPKQAGGFALASSLKMVRILYSVLCPHLVALPEVPAGRVWMGKYL